jgi:hypothetical protein
MKKEMEQSHNSDQLLPQSTNQSKVILISREATPPIIKHDAKALKDIVAYENPEEKKFGLAVFNNIAIKNMDAQDANIALAKLIGAWCFILGITESQIPREQDLNLIIPWIRKHYGSLSVQEIELAIDLSVEGKFDVNINPYNNTLSIRYIGMVLQQYMDYRSETMKKINEQTERYIYQNALPSPLPTAEQEMKTMIDMLTFEYRRYEKTGNVWDYKNYIWDYLKTTGKIIVGKQAVKVAMEEGLKKLSTIIDKKYPAIKSVPDVMQQKIEKENREKMEEGQKNYAREYLLKHFFASRSLDAILRMVKIEDFQTKKVADAD